MHCVQAERERARELAQMHPRAQGAKVRYAARAGAGRGDAADAGRGGAAGGGPGEREARGRAELARR
eukprot:1116262-Rhodomonas_salina.1